jgi:hypothetical protein
MTPEASVLREMSYYIGVIADDLVQNGYIEAATISGMRNGQIWKIEANTAERINVSQSPLNFHQADPGEDIITTLRKRFPFLILHKLELEPGEYYPSMARPSSTRYFEPLGYNPDKTKRAMEARARCTGQLHALLVQLQQICQVVQPVGDNLKTFGHEIRNVLILAATEVEVHWKSVLKAHGVNARNTRDYAKLAAPLKLADFAIDFPWYPWLEPLKPFQDWTCSDSPSQNLAWYDSYNAVKHDRESNFARATLECAFQAISGCFVMLCAQYGWDFALRDVDADRAFLRLTTAPEWAPHQAYVPPSDGTLKPKQYSFDG